jgi:hypothetical protein
VRDLPRWLLAATCQSEHGSEEELNGYLRDLVHQNLQESEFTDNFTTGRSGESDEQ